MSLKQQKIDENQELSPYAEIGYEPVKGQNSSTWFIPLDAVIYDKKSPKDFFVTTGEAIIKIDVLILHLQEQLKKARRLKKTLLATKADNKYLETCWEEGTLLVKAKNPRSRRKRDSE